MGKTKLMYEYKLRSSTPEKIPHTAEEGPVDPVTFYLVLPKNVYHTDHSVFDNFYDLDTPINPRTNTKDSN